MRIQSGLVGQSDPVEQLGDPVAGGNLGGAEVFEGKRHVVRRGPAREQARRLEDGADTSSRLAKPGGSERGQILTVDDHLPRRRALEQIEAAGERALTGTGRADDGEDLALLHPEPHLVEDGRRIGGTDAEHLGQIDGLDHRNPPETSRAVWRIESSMVEPAPPGRKVEPR